METKLFDKDLIMTYLRVAEVERVLTKADREFLGESFCTMKDSVRSKIDPSFLDDVDVSYTKVLNGGIAENEVEYLTPSNDLRLPVRVYLSDETYELLLDYLSSQLFYISTAAHKSPIEIINGYPVEKWSNKRYFELLEKLKLAFEEEGVSYHIFKHNESLGDNDEYGNRIQELLNVYFPMSMKKTLG